jgi:hypothetical protein
MENTTTTPTKRNIKTSGYKQAKRRAKLNARRDAADERMAQHDALSVAQKIAKAKSRRGESKREIARLTALKKA